MDELRCLVDFLNTYGSIALKCLVSFGGNF